MPPPLSELLQRKTPIDEADSDYHQLLGDLQCNILSGHRMPATHYFFLRFGKDDRNAPGILKALAAGSWKGAPLGIDLDSELTSRAKRLLQNASWASARLAADPTPFAGNLLLTATCYTDVLSGIKLELPPDRAFRDGMAGRDEKRKLAFPIHDHPRRGAPGSDQPIHALYTVGYDPERIDGASLIKSVQDYLGAVLVHHEPGYTLLHPSKRWTIEPFGYRDSISQPLFYKSDLQQRQEIEGAAASVKGGKWRSFESLDTVLARDPNGSSDHSCGSYVVFRKLVQDVASFYSQAQSLATKYARTRDDVADGLIGRTIDGKPFGAAAAADYNDFDYTKTVCPAHAHARKVNPRAPEAHSHRIVRRGTVFGPKLVREDSGRPRLDQSGSVIFVAGERSGEVGLLFMCCQADIEEQFEFIQGHWANWPSDGADPVAGQMKQGRMNRIGIGISGLVNDFPSIVKLDSGEYFFAPSLSFFGNL